MQKAKEAGKVRMEGKDYVMADGDVVEFRFNVGGYTELNDRRLAGMVTAAGSEPARQALGLRGKPVSPRRCSRDVYLCHQFCGLGAVLFSDVVDVWHRFLEEHPGDVMVVVVQDELAPKGSFR